MFDPSEDGIPYEWDWNVGYETLDENDARISEYEPKRVARLKYEAGLSKRDKEMHFFHKKQGHEDMFGYDSEGTDVKGRMQKYYSAEGTDPFEWKGTTQVGVSQIKKSSQI